MSAIIQRSLAGGELSPSLYARADQVKYAYGLRTMRNAWTRSDGGSQNRPGTEFVGEVRDSADGQVKLIPFIFSNTQAYILEFGDLYFSIIQDGAYQTAATASPATNITSAAQAVITLPASAAYFDGVIITITGVVGMTEVNGRTYRLENQSGNSFDLRYLNNTAVDSTAFGAYSSGGTITKRVQVVTDIPIGDVDGLKFSQSGDVMTLVHPDYPPFTITRGSTFGSTTWTVDDVVFFPSISVPTSLAASGGAVGATSDYVVTAVSHSGEESLPALQATAYTITDISNAAQAVITIGAHTAIVGDYVQVAGVVGMPELNFKYFFVTAIAATTVTINWDSRTANGSGSYISGGTLGAAFARLVNTVGSSATPITVSWTASTGAKEYNVYRKFGGIYGFIGVGLGPTFSDTGFTPDISINPPDGGNNFAKAGSIVDYPYAVAYIQQRLAFGSTDVEPEAIWMSQIGRYKNFNTSNPLRDDDAVKFTIAGPRLNKIKHIVDIGQMVVFTDSGEFAAGGIDGVVTPSSINIQQHSYHGCNDLTPIVLPGNALYVQSQGSTVRSLAFDVNIDGYRGSDMTTFSKHLFTNHTLTDWTYQQIPHSIVWSVRDDGVLIGMTYNIEQEILAWHRHDFSGGSVENVCAIPEGEEYALYVVVNRTIDGYEARYIERMYTRIVDDIVDSVFLDSAATVDGRNTTATTMTLSGGTSWLSTETLTLTASASFFLSTDVGNEIHMLILDADGNRTDIVRCEIKTYTSATVVSVRPHKTVPVALRSTATAYWSEAVDQVTGLYHLEGENVSVFADGFVVASANNAAYTTVTVTDGTITLDRPYATIHVGLPITSDIETLDIDSPGGNTLADKYKNTTSLTVFLEDTRGGWVGPKPPTDDSVDPLENMIEFKPRSLEDYDHPADLKNGKYELNILPEWNSSGRVFIRQTEPLPMSILAIVPEGSYPNRR